MLGIERFADRAVDTLDRWEFHPRTGLAVGMYQAAQNAAGKQVTTYLPLEKCILWRTNTSKDNPEGRAMYRSGHRTYGRIKAYEDLEGVGIERNLAGLPVMEVPPEMLSPNATADQKAAVLSYEKLMGQVRVDQRAGLVIPAEKDSQGRDTGYRFRLVSPSGRTPADVSPVIVRLEGRLANLFLSEFLLVGLGSVGSWSLHSDKTHLVAMAIGGLLDIWESQLHAQATERLYRLNGFDHRTWARLKHGDIEKQAILEFAQYVTSLVGAGILTPDENLEQRARELGSLNPRSAVTPFVPVPIVDPGAPQFDHQVDAGLLGSAKPTLDKDQLTTLRELVGAVRDRTMSPGAAAMMAHLGLGLTIEQARALVGAQVEPPPAELAA
jgi:hypothetical protein